MLQLIFMIALLHHIMLQLILKVGCIFISYSFYIWFWLHIYFIFILNMKEICLPRGQPSKVKWLIIRVIFTVNVNMFAVVLEVHKCQLQRISKSSWVNCFIHKCKHFYNQMKKFKYRGLLQRSCYQRELENENWQIKIKDEIELRKRGERKRART